MWAYNESLIAMLVDSSRRIIKSRKGRVCEDGYAHACGIEPMQESVCVFVDEADDTIKSEKGLTLALKAVQLQRLGNLKGATDAYDKAISLDAQNTGCLRVQAFLSDHLGRHDKALQIYSTIIQENPIDPCAWLGRAEALFKMEMYEESLEAFEETLMIEPEMVRALIGKGDSLSNLGRRGEAYSAYRKSLSLVDKAIRRNQDNCSAWAWIYRGDACNGLGRHEEAIEAYNCAIEICPGSFQAWCGKGDALMRLCRFGEAASAYDRAISAISSPEQPKEPQSIQTDMRQHP